jgi:hypothetical protein
MMLPHCKCAKCIADYAFLKARSPMPQHHDHQQPTTVEQLQADLRCIALALDASHGAVATDLPDAKPNETHWRIDHTQEQAALTRIAEVLNKKNVL